MVPRSLSWSPLGMRDADAASTVGGGGCLLAVVTNAHHVTLHAPFSQRLDSGLGCDWRQLCSLSEVRRAA